MIARSIFLFFLILSLNPVIADEKDSVIVCGEVGNPGLFHVDKTSTLGALLPDVAKPLSTASIDRVTIIRNGRKKYYKLKSNNSIKLLSGDIISLPVKTLYEGQDLDQEHTLKIISGNPRKSLDRLMDLRIKELKIRKNGEFDLEGVEFRPKTKEPQRASTRVLVQLYYEYANDGSRIAKGLVIYSRNRSNHIGATPKLAYQIDLENRISEICSSEPE